MSILTATNYSIHKKTYNDNQLNVALFGFKMENWYEFIKNQGFKTDF